MEAVRTPVIALVVPAFDKGGLEQVVLNLYRGYRALGAECFVLVENNEVGHMARRLARPEDCFIFNRDEHLFLEAVQSRRVTHLHYHYSTFGLVAMSALGLDTTYTLHNIYTWLEDEDFRRRASEIKASNRIVAVSSFVRDYFCRRANISWEDVLVVPNGTSIDDLARETAIDRGEYGADPSNFVFANIASSHRNKHHAVLVRAAEKLLEHRSDFEILLVGNVGDRAYHDEISDMIARSPAADNVRQVPYVDSHGMGSFYRDVVDCVLLPSIQEGCSNVALEALATGCRMILTDVGNAREAARLSDRVIVVPTAYSNVTELNPSLIDKLSRTGDVRNVDDIADAMLSMIESDMDPVAEEELVSVRDQISVETMIDSYNQILLARDKRWRHLWPGKSMAGTSVARRVGAR